MTAREQDPMEEKLLRVFHPIAPSKDFVRGLHDRIRSTEPEVILRRRTRDWRTALFMAVGALSSAITVLALARILFYFSNRKPHA